MHRLVDLIETVYREQQLLELIHFYRRGEHFVQGEIVDGTMPFNHIQTLAVGTDESAAVDLNAVVLTNEAELDRVPEQPPEFLQEVLISDRCAHPPVMLEEVRKYTVRVHGHVAKDVVKDVGLGRVFERFPVAQPRGGGKAAGGKHLKKSGSRQKSADGCGIPASTGLQARAHGLQVRQAIAL